MRFSYIIAGFISAVTGIPVYANTITVGATEPMKNISSAIAAAKKGDTVLVNAGTYREKNLVINKSIFLIGNNQPVLDGEGKYEMITVHAGDVSINGFQFLHAGYSSREDYAAIKLNSCRNVTIAGNIFSDAHFGVYVQQSVSCRISDNVFIGGKGNESTSGDGIHCWKSDSLQIIHNNIQQFRDGIYLEFVTNSLIWRNSSVNNIRYGLHFMTAHNNAYVTNIFKNNGAGVAVMYTHGVKMLNNYFMNNTGDAAFGLLLKEITDSNISGNHFLNNTTGIFMEGCNRIDMQQNLFKENGWALKIEANCSDVMVERNDYIANTFDVSTNGTLMLNTFNNNYWDKYEGYDLNKDKIGYVPYRPVSMYSMMAEQNPALMMLFRSFITTLMDKTEKVIPSLIPQDLKDAHPLMKPFSS
ncbi:MAG TPA: nitrous oxide reductase family maturation protein NosD [Chitinophagaceae bacterium]|nr:nitrous oxide reductase family maturation protein NosD [Chitinophagaceae bacterium]